MRDIRNIKVFADGALLKDVPDLIERYHVKGFTTNPTLMAKAGVKDYEHFARNMLEAAHGLPVSLEVFANDFAEMKRQALKLAGLGENVYVKVPVTNTLGQSSRGLVVSLAESGVKLNVTAVFTKGQIDFISPSFVQGVPAILSIFAGRIADTGVDPTPIILHALSQVRDRPDVEVLWASCREIYNVVVAAQLGCHIVTVPNDMLAKLALLGKDLTEMSLETVRMFRRDALESSYNL